jgi:predicted enzyme related to lactoylglutathione lyase
MSGPARAGALIYAHDLERLSGFYRRLLGMQLRHADADHQVIESEDIQLIVHAIPPHIAATFRIASPPELREEQALKLFFSVPALAGAATLAASLGGALFGPDHAGPGFTARNGHDPEGNIFQLREWGPAPTTSPGSP